MTSKRFKRNMNKITFHGDTDNTSSYVMIEYGGDSLLDIDFRGFEIYIGKIVGVDVI